MAKPEKMRNPKFTDFDAMMADVKQLAERGYEKSGNWNLGQACSHVADWMLFPIDGFPVPPLPIRMLFWVMKKTVAPGMKRKILAEGFKGGTMTAPDTVAKPEEFSDQGGLEKLQNAVIRLQAYEGELRPSPLFGKMDKAMAVKVSLLHAEHHLGYLKAKN